MSSSWICQHPDLNSGGKSRVRAVQNPPGKRPQTARPLWGWGSGLLSIQPHSQPLGKSRSVAKSGEWLTRPPPGTYQIPRFPPYLSILFFSQKSQQVWLTPTVVVRTESRKVRSKVRGPPCSFASEAWTRLLLFYFPSTRVHWQIRKMWYSHTHTQWHVIQSEKEGNPTTITWWILRTLC